MRTLRRALLLASVPFMCGCAIAHAMAPDAKIDWSKECAAKCKDPTAILVYSQDNSATLHHMALYSLNPPVGCLCPAPPKK